ncbi:MAG TPA: ATP-binding protein [Pelobium sp.]
MFNFKNNLLKATKGKIIFGFVMAIVALTAAWSISKLVFSEMISTVDQVSKPDDKLNLVNQIFTSVSRLDQEQKYLALQENDRSFSEESNLIKLRLDTLSRLYDTDSLQKIRINSIRGLLSQRDEQFKLYLAVRDSLLNTKALSKELDKLNSMFKKRAFESDSAVYTTESKTSSTTLKSDDSKGFFAKIFGKKKPDSYKIISEELKIKRDTLNPFAEDSIIQSMEGSLKTIQNRQKQKSSKFIAKESVLASTSNELTQQMLAVLEEVRNDALLQVAEKGKTARLVVNRGINQITYILLVFFCLTLLLTYLIINDISRSNSYRLALEKAKKLSDDEAKAKQRFLSNMSHEIRTPLQSIIGYSDIIRKSTQSNPQAVEAIHLSANHLLYIINEILDYSRIASGKFNLKNEAFEAAGAINEVLLVMQPLAQSKNLLLSADKNIPDILWLKGDAFRLKQILYNLLGNAIKFSEKGSVKLSVNSSEIGNNLKLEIQVSDTGVGISEHKINSIFDEFDNGDQQETFDFKSTGLGLSIVKQLVKLHNGSISLTSTEGLGSTFFVSLNYNFISENEIGATAKPIKKNRSFTKKMVWIIDDDALILDMCGIILSQKSIAYQTFSRPKLMLESTIPTDLAFVFMDMRMPELDGISLFKQIKPKVTANVKFYAITAQVLPAEQKNILDAGFDGIINKPFTEVDLLNVLSEETPIFDNIDAANLRKMTFGDTAQMSKILKRFVSDSLTDIELLNQVLKTYNLADCGLITHRLAGRIGQIGFKDLAFKFRKLEQKLNLQNSLTDDLVHEIGIEVEGLQQFISFIKNKNYSI